MLLIHCHRFGTNFAGKNIVLFLKKDSKIIVPKKWNYICFLELYFGETFLEKGFQNYSSEKKKELYSFWIIFWWNTFEKGFQNYSSEKERNYIFFGIIFWWNTFAKGFQNYSSEKKELYIFFELYFGETLLKKDSKIIVPKKKGTIFFLNYILVKHFWKRIRKL